MSGSTREHAAGVVALAEVFAERRDEALRELWCGLRNDASDATVRMAEACIDFARACGLLSAEQAELWRLRLGTCPGHDDEGGRDWCAYGCKLP